mmetsp:Transcript_60520/g.163187  ORF Transcript_60520/g.163187 Transcript_60520/m.163187 type:complete len:222 (-) Transcript_60520:183-848(-)
MHSSSQSKKMKSPESPRRTDPRRPSVAASRSARRLVTCFSNACSRTMSASKSPASVSFATVPSGSATTPLPPSSPRLATAALNLRAARATVAAVMMERLHCRSCSAAPSASPERARSAAAACAAAACATSSTVGPARRSSSRREARASSTTARSCSRAASRDSCIPMSWSTPSTASRAPRQEAARAASARVPSHSARARATRWQTSTAHAVANRLRVRALL